MSMIDIMYEELPVIRTPEEVMVSCHKNCPFIRIQWMWNFTEKLIHVADYIPGNNPGELPLSYIWILAEFISSAISYRMWVVDRKNPKRYTRM